jgi:hypothetical protein
VTGLGEGRRVPLPWHRSARGERGSLGRTTVLDLVMLISVATALLVFCIWFLFFAHYPVIA